ncbi:MAG TPA: hypothetical protein VE032_07205 [Actinomycetota bacterium]|nr:hypothetical protein [Actinomycetota bacterium]
MVKRLASVTALAFLLVAALLSAVPAPAASAARRDLSDRVPVSGTDLIEKIGVPRQPTAAEASQVAVAAATTESQCIDSEDVLVLTIPSFDPAHPGTQDVVFHRETPADAPGRARIWVAWDFLATDWGPPDEIGCDQVEYLQGAADEIIDTDVHYFGDYLARGDGGKNVDILTYNVVDELYYDPTFESFIAGFYSSSFQAEFDRNIFFLDSLIWSFGLGPDAARPFDVEATFAHELEHLIMNDHDADELSWIDEGLADLAIYLNGFGHPADHVTYYLAFHRNSLTDWQSTLEDYGAAYLFELYLLENFGQQTNGVWGNGWTRAMLDEQANGIAGVEARTGASMQDLYDTWIMANLQDTPNVTGRGGFPMGYDLIDLNPFVSEEFGVWSIRRSIKDIYGADVSGNLPINRYGGGSTSGSVEFPLGTAAPYSPIYKSYGGASPSLAVQFRGEAQSGVAPPDGTHLVASGGGTLLTDRTLSLETSVGGSLTFQTWFDIEEEWDFGFVEASTDGGATWAPLAGSITRTSTNPNGSTAWANALGAASSSDAVITGSSGGWVEGSFDLPAASGVLVRFNYFTDEAANGKGWFIDQVEVDGVSESFEAGTPDWDLGGWSVSTGLFDNDWVLGFANPTKSGSVATSYVDPVDTGDGFQRSATLLDTTKLNSDRVVLVFANRPAEDAFDAGYLLLVSKKG